MTCVDGVGTTYSALPELNVSLLESAVRWAEYDSHKPDQPSWDQEQWARAESENFCDSSFCIAGYAAVQQGMLELRLIALCGDESCCPTEWDYVRTSGLSYFSYFELGKKALGLTQAEAKHLFDGGNDIDHIRHLAKDIAASRGVSIDI